MGKFKSFLNEIRKSELMRNTDKKRRKLSKEMRVRPPKIITMVDGMEKMEYAVKMQPASKSVEGRNHRGFIIYDPKNKDIKRVHCDCLDYNYVLWKPMVNNDLDSWELTKREQKRQVVTNNKANAVERNPNDKLFACKHIYAILRDYF